MAPASLPRTCGARSRKIASRSGPLPALTFKVAITPMLIASPPNVCLKADGRGAAGVEQAHTQPLIPAKADPSGLAAAPAQRPHQFGKSAWVPAFAGMSGI